MRLLDRLTFYLARKAASASGRLALVASNRQGKAVWSDWSTEQAIRGALQASGWVYACVRKRAQALSSLPWFVEQRVGEGEWERDDSHPLSQLLAHPNYAMSRQDVFERMIYHLDLGGNSLWHLVLVQGQPVELWPLPPDRCKPIPGGAEQWVSGYEYREEGGSQKRILPPEQVAHLMYVDPSNPYWGLAPLKAAAQVVDTDVEAVRWNKVSLQNRSVPDGVFSTPQLLTKEQWEEVRRQVREQHLGADNAHTPWVVSGGAVFESRERTPVEMDFLRTRQFHVAEIAVVFGVPVVLLSAERTTFNNMETGRKIFWQDTIIPLADDIKDALDSRFVPLWNPEAFPQSGRLGNPEARVLRVNYDASQVPVMQEVWGTRVDTGRKLWDMGVPLNAVNQRLGLGLDAVEGGDLPWGGHTPAASGLGAEGDASGQSDQGDGEGNKGRQHKSIGAMSPAEKAAFWRGFDRDRAAREKTFAGQIAGQFRAEAEVVAAAYEAGGERAALAAVNEGKAAWLGTLKGPMVEMVGHFGSLEWRRLMRAAAKARRLPRQHKATAGFAEHSTAVQEFLRTRTAQAVTAMSATTKDKLAAVIAEGVQATEGSGEIAKRIREAYAQWAGEGDSPLDRSRSYLIARTEAGAAVNFGHHEGAAQVAEETGVTILKEWLASLDDRTRESHAEVNGEQVGLDDDFSNGLPYPNAEGAPAEEACNCRCSVAHVVTGL